MRRFKLAEAERGLTGTPDSHKSNEMLPYLMLIDKCTRNIPLLAYCYFFHRNIQGRSFVTSQYGQKSKPISTHIVLNISFLINQVLAILKAYKKPLHSLDMQGLQIALRKYINVLKANEKYQELLKFKETLGLTHLQTLPMKKPRQQESSFNPTQKSIEMSRKPFEIHNENINHTDFNKTFGLKTNFLQHSKQNESSACLSKHQSLPSAQKQQQEDLQYNRTPQYSQENIQSFDNSDSFQANNLQKIYKANNWKSLSKTNSRELLRQHSFNNKKSCHNTSNQNSFSQKFVAQNRKSKNKSFTNSTSYNHRIEEYGKAGQNYCLKLQSQDNTGLKSNKSSSKLKNSDYKYRSNGTNQKSEFNLHHFLPAPQQEISVAQQITFNKNYNTNPNHFGSPLNSNDLSIHSDFGALRSWAKDQYNFSSELNNNTFSAVQNSSLIKSANKQWSSQQKRITNNTIVEQTERTERQGYDQNLMNSDNNYNKDSGNINLINYDVDQHNAYKFQDSNFQHQQLINSGQQHTFLASRTKFDNHQNQQLISRPSDSRQISENHSRDSLQSMQALSNNFQLRSSLNSIVNESVPGSQTNKTSSLFNTTTKFTTDNRDLFDVGIMEQNASYFKTPSLSLPYKIEFQSLNSIKSGNNLYHDTNLNIDQLIKPFDSQNILELRKSIGKHQYQLNSSINKGLINEKDCNYLNLPPPIYSTTNDGIFTSPQLLLECRNFMKMKKSWQLDQTHLNSTAGGKKQIEKISSQTVLHNNSQDFLKHHQVNYNTIKPTEILPVKRNAEQPPFSENYLENNYQKEIEVNQVPFRTSIIMNTTDMIQNSMAQSKTTISNNDKIDRSSLSSRSSMKKNKQIVARTSQQLLSTICPEPNAIGKQKQFPCGQASPTFSLGPVKTVIEENQYATNNTYQQKYSKRNSTQHENNFSSEINIFQLMDGLRIAYNNEQINKKMVYNCVDQLYGSKIAKRFINCYGNYFAESLSLVDLGPQMEMILGVSWTASAQANPSSQQSQVYTVYRLLDIEMKGYVLQDDVLNLLQQLKPAQLDTYPAIQSHLKTLYRRLLRDNQNRVTFWSLYASKQQSSFSTLVQLLSDFEFEIDDEQQDV